MEIEQIWTEYRYSLKAFLNKNLANSSDTEDVLQEILIKVHQNMYQLHDVNKIKSWLFQIAHNAIADYYRKKAQQQNLATKSDGLRDDDDDIYQQLINCVEPFIQALEPDEAELLSAIDIQGLSQKHYAELNNIKYSTLKSRVKKSRINLQRLFNQCCHFELDSHGRLVGFEHSQNSNSSECQKCSTK